VFRVIRLKKIITAYSPLFALLALTVIAPIQAGDPNQIANNEAVSAGQTLYENSCLSCHSPKRSGQIHGGGRGASADAEAGHQNRLAPPMAMVKRHYLQEYPGRDEFVQRVTRWIVSPDQDSALLSHAVERFGLMPPLVLDENSRRQIARYIFDSIVTGQCKKGGGDKHKGGQGSGHSSDKKSRGCHKI
jgi:hypothetical protein